MKYSNSIEYNISTKLDKSGITQLQAQIKQLENSMQQMSNRELIDSEKVQSARAQLQGLNTALTNSFNPSLGILDFTKFRAELDKNNVSALQLKSVFNTMGVEGQKVLKGLTTQIANFNGGMERTSSTIDKMFVTFSNTFRWGLISSFFSQFMNAIHSSVQYTKDLDDSLTQIMLVTDYSRDSMNEYARAANEAAKAVGQTTVGMTNASLIFAQQGYDLNQSQQLATLSAKLANASQQDTAATSDQITAYMNAYGLQDSMDELVQAMDNWAKIANISAADVEEIALASQRAASMANAVGVSGEALAAQIATIESVTREAPEQIGNGLKTLYARFSDLKFGKDDEDGIGLGKVTSTLQQIGVQVLDAFGNVRDMDDIMEDLMVVWEDLDDTSKTAAAQALAGKHQVNRFMALMENADMYQEYKGATGVSASGTLEQMNAEYLDSLPGRMTKLQASLEGLFSSIFNTDDIYPWIDKAQDAVDLLQKFFDALGGGKTILLGMATLFGKLFNQNIAHSINSMMENAALGQTRKNNVESINQTLDRAGIDSSQGVGAYIRETAEQTKLGALSNDQYRTYLDNVQNWTNNSIALAEAEQQLTDTINIANAVFKKVAGDAPFKQKTDEAGTTTVTGGFDAREVDVKERKEAIQNIDFTEEIQQTKKVTLELNNLHDSMESLGKDGTTSVQDIKNKIAELIQSLNGLDNVYDLDKVEDLRNALFDLENELNETGNASDESKKKVADYGREIGELNKRLHEMDSSAAERVINDSGREAEQQAIELNFRRVAEQNAKQKAMDDQASINRQQAVKSILDVVNAVQQLTFSYQAFKNIGSIWANEDLTKGEKVLQTIMNLTMALPQLINAMKVLQSTDLMGNIAQVSKFAKTLQELGIPGSKKFVDSLKNIGSESEDTKKLLAGLSPAIGEAMATAAAEGASGLGVLSAGFKALAAELAPVLVELLPFIAAAAAIGAIVALVQYEMEQVEKAKEAAIDALHEAQDALEQIKNIQDQVNSFNTSYGNYDGSNGQELIDEANNIALAMKDAGFAAEAEAIHLATVRAKALNTAEGFEILANTIEESTRQAEASANLEVIKASEEVLRTQNKSMEDMIKNQADLRRAQEQLNNLDPWSPNYEARKAELEALIATLEETIKAEQDAVDAANAAMDAQGTLAGINALGLNGDNNGMQTKARGWENTEGPADTVRTADAETLREFFSLNVQGFDALSSAEQLDFMLQHVQDDAQKAAIEVQQLFEANSSLGEHHFGETTYFDSEEITKELEQSGLSAQQSLTLIASLDPNASKQEILAKVHQIQAEMDANGGDFELALRATLDPEELERVKEQVKDSIPSMTPIDSDLNADAFQETAKYFYEMAGELEEIPEELAYSSEELQEFTEAVLRYDDALQDADEHLADWIDTLNDSSASISDQTEAFEGMRDLIGDLLDLDTSDLSHSFMKSAEAAELLDTAIYGTGEEADLAYSRLNALANLDMAGFLDWENGAASLNDRFYELSDSALSVSDNAQYAMTTLEGIMNGTITGPDINIDNFLAGLEDMVNSGQMSMDEAMAAMDGAEIEADVTTETQDVDDVQQTIGWRPVKTGTIDVSASNIPVSFPDYREGWYNGVKTADAHGTVEGWAYEPDTNTETESKSVTVAGVGYKANRNGTGTGKVHFSNGRHKLNSGGAKRAASGGGNHSRPSSGGGGGCFVAGTLVSLQNQFKNIEDIQIGDIVLSYNEEIHQNEYSIVLQTMIHDVTEEIYDLYIEDEILTVTGIHRFYVRRKHNIDWIPASNLYIGDYVLFADGNWHPIFKIKVKVRSLLVYNFEVSHNHNYYVGHNQILAHNKGGGGGGGGSAKTIQPKEKKEHKKDYYEKVNSQLDKLKEQLSGIEKQEDRLIGDKARANQAKQIALIRKEIDLEKERLKILQDTKDSELKDVRAAITAKDTAAQDILKGRGIKFNIPEPEYDENGIITNYEKISEKIDEAHNKLIDQYNAAAKVGNEDLTKTIEEAIKKYDDYSGAILENVQRQNDIQKEIESTKNTIQELEDSIEDIQIELYKASMEAIDNLKDLNEKWAEFEGFLTGMPTDSPFRDLTVDLLKLNSTFEIGKEDAAKYYQEIIDGKIAAQNATTDQAEKEAIQASINYFVGLRDGLTDDMLNNGLLGLAMEDLKQLEKWYKDPSLKDNPFGNNQKALAEAYQEGYERVLELSQDWQDLQEDIIDSVISGYDEIADKQDRQLGKYTRLADQLEQLADEYALSYGDESYQALSDIGKQQGETLRAQLQQYKEIYNYWQNEYQEALKTGNEELINSIEDHMNDVEDEMRDIANEAAETFVDAYEKAVDAAIQKMNKTLIGEADFDRLDRNWEWQDKMIEGYLDDVEKAYEIEKLRGDYMDMLNEAQGASLATQNKIRAAMNEQLQLLEDQTTVSQFDVDLANARLLVLQKQIALEDAQRNKNQMQLRRDSQGNYRYVYRANQDEIAKARKELLDAEREVYKMSQDHMKEVRQNVADAINEFIDQWRTISTDPNLSEDQRKEQLEELVNNIKPILAVYAEDLKNGSDGIAIALGDMINSSTDEMATAASDMLSKIYDEEGKLAEKTGTLWWDVVAKFTNEIFPNIDSAIATLATTTYGEMDQLRNNLTGPDGVIPDVTDALVGEDGFRPALIAAADAITNEDPTKGLNAAMKSLGDSLEAENTKLKEGINNITNYTTALAGAITTLSQAQGAITDLQKITLDNVVYQFKAEVQDNTQNASPNIEAASYDTGGYTGDWGEDGKIAILHQKELILNAEDTRNILSAVDIVRQMTSTLGNVLANYSIGDTPNSLASSVFNTVDQRVEIKAEFPNVKDAFEIETALTNLSDKAYQYAHRKI